MINLITDLISFTQPTNLDKESLSVIESIAKIKKVVNECITQFNNLENKTDEDYNNFLKQIKDYKNYIENLCKQYRNETLEIIQEFKDLIKALEDIEETVEWIKKQSEFVQDLAKQNQDNIDKGTIATKDEINKINTTLNDITNYTNGYALEYLGMNLFFTNRTYERDIDEKLIKMKEHNMNAVYLVVYNTINYSNNTFNITKDVEDSKINYAINKAKELRFKQIVIKPHFYNRELINNTNVTNFLVKLKENISKYIELSKTNNLNGLFIGNEIKQASSSNLDLWLDIIKNVTEHNLECYYSLQGFDEFYNCVFCDYLTNININLYPKIEGINLSENVNLNECITKFNNNLIGEKLERLKKSFPNKKVYISEIGVTRNINALDNPEQWEFETTTQTYKGQYIYYYIILNILSKSNIDGIFFWCADDGLTNCYTPFGNPSVEKLLKDVKIIKIGED